jgi:hypothetical protein
MGAWEFVRDALEPVAGVLLLIALGWAASERGRVHQHLALLRRGSGSESASRAEGFSAMTGR